jgi:TP901 family phage tail tape measure protein
MIKNPVKRIREQSRYENALGQSAASLGQPLGNARAGLSGVSESLEGINPSGLERLRTGLAGLAAKGGEVKAAFASFGIDFKTDMLERGKRGIEQINAGLDKIGKNSGLTAIAGHLSRAADSFAAFSGKISAMMDEPSKLSMSFESSLKNIQVVTGFTSTEMETLKGELLSIGGKAVAGPLAIAEAYNDVAGGITNTEAQLGVLNSSVALVEAGHADLGVAANGMVKVMNAYGFANLDAVASARKAQFAADVFTQTVGMGVGSMDEFVASMSPIAGLSASVGVGFDEVGAAMSFATSKGQTASVAAIQIKAAMISLLNPNETLAKALQSIGVESGSAMLKEYGLAESLNIVKTALGGRQDAMAKALGSTEALQIAVALTNNPYDQFASDFASGALGITESARAIQLESLESKMARLEAASSSIKVRMGEDINHIKGFFVDMRTGFLQNVATPILNSPVGGVISQIVAAVSVGGAQFLSMGSAALNTATQMTTLAANIKNAGGYAQILKGTMTVLGVPFHAAASSASKLSNNLFRIGVSSLPAAAGTGTLGATSAGAAGGMGAAAGASTALGAGLWATLSPILLVVAAIALIAGAAYLIVKNWDSVSAFFTGLWNKITGIFISVWNGITSFLSSVWSGITGLFSNAINGIKSLFMSMPNWVVGLLAIFFPFISIPVFIVTKWDALKAFFASLWENIQCAVTGFVTWLIGVWDEAALAFKSVWTAAGEFFSSLWQGIVSVVLGVVNWFNGAWTSVVSAFTAAWTAVYTFFTAIWNAIVTFVLGIVNWFTGIWDIAVSGFMAVWSYASSFFGGIWNGIAGVVSGFVNWLTGIWESVVSVFTMVWGYVYTFFGGIWEGIKSVVLGFIAWLGGAVEFIVAPFKKVAEVVGGVLDGIGGFFKGLIGESDAAGSQVGENLSKTVAGGTSVSQSAISPKPVASKSEVAPNTDKPEFWDSVKGQSAVDFTQGLSGGKVAGQAPELPQTSMVATIPTAVTPVELVPAVPTPVAAFAPMPVAALPASITGTETTTTFTPIAGTGTTTAGRDTAAVPVKKMNGHAGTIMRGASGAFAEAMGTTATGIMPPDMSSQSIASITTGSAIAPASAQVSGISAPSVIAPQLPIVDMSEVTQQAAGTVRERMQGKNTVLETVSHEATQSQAPMNQSITIQNLYLQAEDCKTVFDLMRMIIHAVHNPQEVTA